MRTQRKLPAQIAGLIAALFLVAGQTGAAEPSATDVPDFAEVGRTLTRLLQDGDAAAFAKALAPSLADWQAAFSTNRPAQGKDPLGPAFQKSLDDQRHKLEACAKRLLATAAELKLDFSRAQLTARLIPPQRLGGARLSPPMTEQDKYLPSAQQLEVVVAVAPASGTPGADHVRGEYTVSLRDLIRFPTGWRCPTGPLWVTFPPGVATGKIQHEVTLASRAAAYAGLAQADDPALARLGELLGRFLQTRDPKLLETEALLPPGEGEAEERVALIAAARRTADLMGRYGVDLGDAVVQVKNAAFQSLWSPGGLGVIEGIVGYPLTVTLTVQSSRQSKLGASLSGDYSLSAQTAVRKGDRWCLTDKVLGVEFPPGILDEQATRELALEKYVAEHGTLPPGNPAPDIGFVRLDNEQRMRLADLRGQVVILDFWAVPCGPCQAPLEKMQKYQADYPEWSNRVRTVALSVDHSPKAARDHLTKRGWTNTFNVWAPGGFDSVAAKEYRLNSIPQPERFRLKS